MALHERRWTHDAGVQVHTFCQPTFCHENAMSRRVNFSLDETFSVLLTIGSLCLRCLAFCGIVKGDPHAFLHQQQLVVGA